MKGETESGYIPLKIDKTFNIFINQVSFSKSKYFECFLSLNSCIWSWLNIANTLLVARCARFFVVPRRVAVLRDDILPAEIFQNQRLHIIFKSMFQIKFRDPFSELNGQKKQFSAERISSNFFMFTKCVAQKTIFGHNSLQGAHYIGI